jgi:hypothetical protein
MIILTWSDYCADCQTNAMLHTVTVQNVQITKYFWMRTENKFAKKNSPRQGVVLSEMIFKSVKGCIATKAKLGPIAAATNKIRPRREMDGGRCGHCFSHPFLPFFLCRQAPVSRMLLRAVISSSFRATTASGVSPPPLPSNLIWQRHDLFRMSSADRSTGVAIVYSVMCPLLMGPWS